MLPLVLGAKELGVCRLGDSNGDCSILSTDLSGVDECIVLGDTSIQGDYECADIYDLNGDGSVTSADSSLLDQLFFGTLTNELQGCPEEIITSEIAGPIEINTEQTLEFYVNSLYGVNNGFDARRGATGVLFSIDPSSTADALLVGKNTTLGAPNDEIIEASEVYATTKSAVSNDGTSSIVIKPLTAGTLVINMLVEGNIQKTCTDVIGSVTIEVVNPPCIDNDGDGYSAGDTSFCVNTEIDCADDDGNRFPGNTEICGDGIDQDCDGSDLACPAPTSSSGGSSSGGSSGPFCIPEWVCGEWTSCVDGEQTRFCNDVKECPEIESEKRENRDCEITETEQEPEVVDETPEVTGAAVGTSGSSVVWLLIALGLLAIGSGGYLYYRKRK